MPDKDDTGKARRAAKGSGAAAKPSAAEPSAAKTAAAKTAARRKASAPAPPAVIPYSADDIAEIFRRLHVQRPNPTSELEHRDAFTLLVAVVMSAQMTDVGVNRATRALFPQADTPAGLAAMDEDQVAALIGNVTFARTKARNLVKLSQILFDRHGDAVPQDREALEALPGVGPKTARVVLNTAFGEDYLGVDTHIFRIGNRLGLAPGRTPDEVERNFLRVIPPEYLRYAHHLLLLHGRYVCKARRPDCGICVIADLCRAEEKWNDVPAPLVPIPVEGPGLQGAPTIRVAGP